MIRNDNVLKLSQEIKLIIQNLQKENRKKDKLADKYAKLIQGFKRERVPISYCRKKKKKLTDFLKKQEEEKQKIKYEKQIKKRTKQMELYSKMLAIQNRRQKRKKYYKYESHSSDYEDSVEDDIYKKKKETQHQKK